MDIGLIEESSRTMPNCEKILPLGPIPYIYSLLMEAMLRHKPMERQSQEQTIRYGMDYGDDEFLEDDGYNVSGQPNQQLGAPYYPRDHLAIIAKREGRGANGCGCASSHTTSATIVSLNYLNSPGQWAISGRCQWNVTCYLDTESFVRSETLLVICIIKATALLNVVHGEIIAPSSLFLHRSLGICPKVSAGQRNAK
jgi:hypothetical protein